MFSFLRLLEFQLEVTTQEQAVLDYHFQLGLNLAVVTVYCFMKQFVLDM